MAMSFPSGFGSEMPRRPKKRRDRLAETYIFQLRIDLAGAQPPIWRRIEIRSEVSLWTLHRVIQAAFGWWEAHLYRFSLGAPYSWDSELFLCEYDVAEGEDEGTYVDDVRLDETLQNPGETLQYLYDYGDSWHHEIILEKVRPVSPQDPTAVCTAGQRAAPPEDSGGAADGEFLAEILEDPSYFDLDATNELIRSWLATAPGFAPAAALSSLPAAEQEEYALLLRFPQFRHIVDYYYNQETRAEIISRLQRLEPSAGAATSDALLDASTLQASFSAVQLMLDEVGDGIRLTKAGYLPPKIAFRIGEELGLKGFWLSSGGESKMLEVIEFRAVLQHVGLFRKHKGDLLPTKVAKNARADRSRLWKHLASRLLPPESSDRTFAHDAGLLTLLIAATPDDDVQLNTVAELMTQSGWRVNYAPVEDHHVVFQGAWQPKLLWYVAPKEQRQWFSNSISPVASELARAALLGMKPAYPVSARH